MTMQLDEQHPLDAADDRDSPATSAEEQRQVAEEIRRAADQMREAAERMREAAEHIRIEGEAVRRANEEMRQLSEETRRSREMLRDASEQARVAAENLRQQHERARQAAAEQSEVLEETRKASREIDRLVRDRAEFHRSGDWIDRVSRAIVQAGDAVRTAMIVQESAKGLKPMKDVEAGGHPSQSGATGGSEPRPGSGLSAPEAATECGRSE